MKAERLYYKPKDRVKSQIIIDIILVKAKKEGFDEGYEQCTSDLLDTIKDDKN